MPFKPRDHDHYLSKATDGQRAALEKLRAQIHRLLPAAEECISYNLPAFRFEGKVLLGYGSWKTHCALYPWSGQMVPKFSRELAGFETTRGSIHFQPGKPLPLSLIKKLINARLEENERR